MLLSPEISLTTVALLLVAPASAQTYNINGTLKGLAGEDYSVSGSATLDNGTWTISGDLKSTTPPAQCQTINAPNGNLTDSSGVVWSWGPGAQGQGNWRILRNGQQLTGSAATMSLANDWIFVRNSQGLWFKYAPTEWVQQSGPPAGC